MPPVSFPLKLWNTLNVGPHDLIRWSDDGLEVYVNEDRFEELMYRYPTFLRQPTLSSLRRLFAVYGFQQRERRTGLAAGWTCYSHPYFVRGQTTLLELFVLSHQTRRYNTRKAARICDIGGGGDCKRQKTPDSANLARHFVTGSDSKDDLRPIRCCSLFQFPFGAGLDVESDSSAGEQPSLSHQTQGGRKQNCVADCGSIIETDVDDSDASFCPQEEVSSNRDSWMFDMNEDEQWFGMKDQPLAVAVPSDFGQQDVVDNTPNYASLLQMPH